MCQTHVPDWMWKAYQNAESPEQEQLLSVAIASEQCDDLVTNGVEHIHLYTLNKPDLPTQVCQAIGIEPRPLSQTASAG